MESPIAETAFLIRHAIRSKNLALLEGPPGVGKTQMINGIARSFNLPCYTLIGAICAPEDINGMPVVAESYVDARGHKHPTIDYAPQQWIRRCNETGGIINIDEITSAGPSIQAAMLRSMLDYVFGDFGVDSDRVGIVAAANPPDVAANGQELADPMVDRLGFYHYPAGQMTETGWSVNVATVREWCSQFVSYWGFPPKLTFLGEEVPETIMMRARSSIVSFLHRHPELWYCPLKDDQKVFGAKGASPRSWEAVSRSVARALADGTDLMRIVPSFIAHVGVGPGTEFAVHLREEAIPDPEEILKNPKGYTPLGRIDFDFAALMSVAAAVGYQLTGDRFLAACEVVGERAPLKNSKGVTAHEAGSAAAIRLIEIFKNRQADLVKDIPANKRAAFTARFGKCLTVYNNLLKEAGIKLS